MYIAWSTHEPADPQAKHHSKRKEENCRKKKNWKGKNEDYKKKILRENSDTTGSQTDNEFWLSTHSSKVDVIDLSKEAG